MSFSKPHLSLSNSPLVLSSPWLDFDKFISVHKMTLLCYKNVIIYNANHLHKWDLCYYHYRYCYTTVTVTITITITITITASISSIASASTALVSQRSWVWLPHKHEFFQASFFTTGQVVFITVMITYIFILYYAVQTYDFHIFTLYHWLSLSLSLSLLSSLPSSSLSFRTFHTIQGNSQLTVTYVGSSWGFLSCSFLPMLNPQKQIANIGATPTTGAAIPLYRPRNPYNDKDINYLGFWSTISLKKRFSTWKTQSVINTENKLMDKYMSTHAPSTEAIF